MEASLVWAIAGVMLVSVGLMLLSAWLWPCRLALLYGCQ